MNPSPIPFSDFRFTRYNKMQRTIIPSASDMSLYDFALRTASQHDSRGSYSMAAILSLKKPYSVGLNSLHSPAFLKDDAFPEACGVHAELSLWYNTPTGKLRNGIVAIAGFTSRSRNEMSNTLPCVYCSALLTQSGVKWILFNQDNRVVKARL